MMKKSSMKKSKVKKSKVKKSVMKKSKVKKSSKKPSVKCDLLKMQGKHTPKCTFKTRVRDNKLKSENPYKWKDVHSNDLFKNKRVILFSLPGAFTPTCSTSHLPDYDKLYHNLKQENIDDVYCLSVNDAFVMNKWGKQLKVKNVKLIPDGNAEFTKKMGALVKKNNLGFGDRSWRYSMIVNNGKIEKIFSENGFQNNMKSDPYKVSDAHSMLKYLKSLK